MKWFSAFVNNLRPVDPGAGAGGVHWLVIICVIALQPFGVSAQESRAPVSTGIAVVLASSLNVRATPRLEGAVVGAVQRGDTVCVTGRDSDWLRVRSPASRRPEGQAADPRPAATILDGFAARGFLSEIRLAPEALRAAGC